MIDPLIIEALRKISEAADLLRLVLDNKERAAGGAGDEPVNWSFLDTQLNQLDFGPGYTVRLRHMFETFDNSNLRLVTVRDLVALSEADILRQVNIGRQCLNRIKAMLEPHGLHLGMKLSITAVKQTNHAVQ